MKKRKEIYVIRQELSCGAIVATEVKHDTTPGWRAAHARLARKVDQHFESCEKCRQHLALSYE